VNPFIYLLVCTVYAGPDPGIMPGYVPTYHVVYATTIREMKETLKKNPNCELYKARRMAYTLQSKTVTKEVQEITDVEIQETQPGGDPK